MTYSKLRTLLLSTGIATLSAGAASADTILTTVNGIIENYLCVGAACSNPETYDNDEHTLRLKAVNTRIEFSDSSTTAGFPTTDWRLKANDDFSGGASYFALLNDTDGRVPFTISAGARTNAFFMDNQGRIGMGTAFPTNDFHIRTGNNPSVRLEQDSSSGFIPQTWDFAGNGTLFFVRDVTGGNTLPFVVRAGAPNNAFGINSNGNVGVGTSLAEERFHVKGPGNQVARIESTNNGNATLQLQSGSANRKVIARNSTGAVQSQILLQNGQIRLTGPTTDAADTYLIAGPNGIATRGPNCNPGPCDATFDPEEFEVPSIKEHAAYMWENQHLWAVGPTKPNEPINLTQKTGGIIHELEVAHIYIEQLHDRLEEQAAEKSDLRAQLDTQQSQLDELKALVGTLLEEDG